MKKTVALALLFCCSAILFAAPVKMKVGLLLEFVEGKQLTVTPSGGKKQSLGKELSIGDLLAVGSTIATGKGTSIELKLLPNGTILKLMPDTVFRFVSLAEANKPLNAFELVAGKVRAVAAKGSEYSFKTQNAVLGVRGTDFILAFKKGKESKVLVKQGKIEYAKLDKKGNELEVIEVEEGEEADAYDDEFDAEAYDEEEFEEYYEDADFEELDEEFEDLYDDGELDEDYGDLYYDEDELEDDEGLEVEDDDAEEADAEADAAGDEDSEVEDSGDDEVDEGSEDSGIGGHDRAAA